MLDDDYAPTNGCELEPVPESVECCKTETAEPVDETTEQNGPDSLGNHFVRQDQYDPDILLASTIDDNTQVCEPGTDASFEYSQQPPLSSSADRLARARAQLRAKQRARELFQLRGTLEDHFARQDANFVHISVALDRIEALSSSYSSISDSHASFEIPSPASAMSTQQPASNSDAESVYSTDDTPTSETLPQLQRELLQGQALRAPNEKEQLLAATQPAADQYTADIERLKYDNEALLGKIEAAEAARELAGVTAKRLAEQHRVDIDRLQRTVERLGKALQFREVEREEAIATAQRLEILNAEYRHQIEQLEFECSIVDTDVAGRTNATALTRHESAPSQAATANDCNSPTSTFSILRLYELDEDSNRHSLIDERPLWVNSSIPSSQNDAEVAQPVILAVEDSSSPAPSATAGTIGHVVPAIDEDLPTVSRHAAADLTDESLPDNAALPEPRSFFSAPRHEQAPVTSVTLPSTASPFSPAFSNIRTTGHIRQDSVGLFATAPSNDTRPTLPRASIFSSIDASGSNASKSSFKPPSTASRPRLSLRERENVSRPTHPAANRPPIRQASVRAGAGPLNDVKASTGAFSRPLGDRTNSSSVSSGEGDESTASKTSDKGKTRVGSSTTANSSTRAVSTTAASARQPNRVQSVPARAATKIFGGAAATASSSIPGSSTGPVNHRRAGAITSLPAKRPSTRTNNVSAGYSASATGTKPASRAVATEVASNSTTATATTWSASINNITALNLGEFVAVIMPDATTTASGRTAVRRRAVVFHTNPTPKPRPGWA